MSKIYIGAIGLEVILATGQDLTQASKVEMHVRKPDGSIVTWACSKGIEGQLIHSTTADDIKDSGRYKIQAYVEWGNGASKHHGETAIMQVDKEFS